MDKDIVILKHRLDVCMRPIQMWINVGILIVLQINPLAMLDLSLLYFLLDSIVVVRPLINNAHNTVDLVLIQYFEFIEDIYPTEIKIALVLRRVLFIGVDVDYVAAQLLPVHTNKEFIYTFNHKLYHFYLCIVFLKVKLYLVFLYIPLSNFLLAIECFHLFRLSSVNISKLLLSNNFYLFCPFSFSNTITVSEAKLKLTTILSNNNLLSIWGEMPCAGKYSFTMIWSNRYYYSCCYFQYASIDCFTIANIPGMGFAFSSLLV